jgi:hypothetical protein
VFIHGVNTATVRKDGHRIYTQFLTLPRGVGDSAPTLRVASPFHPRRPFPPVAVRY